MVKVIGTTGKLIEFEVRGTFEVQQRLKRLGIQISKASDIALVRAGGFMQDEIRESVAGKRAEVRSVDTGRFIRSIEAGDLRKDSIKVKSDVPYAKILEFGGTNRAPRSHFRNSLARNKEKIRKTFQTDIKTFSKL